MTADEIRDLNDEEIVGMIEDKQEALFRLRFRAASQAIDVPSEFRSLRRDVARLKTVLREREMANG